MITRHDAERIAASINAFRPEWPAAQVMTLCGELRDWPALDLFVGLAYVAADPDSKTPYRVREQGPWRTVGRTSPADEEARLRARREYADRLASAEARSRAVAACVTCDERGYLASGRVCPHTEQGDAAHRGAARARANIRPTITAERRLEDA